MEDPNVVYEDGSILVLNKPAGWVVNDAVTAHGNPIVQNWLKENFSYEISGMDDMRSGIVHRLDKETSGLLVIAKNQDVFINLQKQFADREVKKEYLALVHGKFKNPKEDVVATVGRLPWNRERFGILPSGKPAETGFERLKIYKDKQGSWYSLVRAFPKTGRTHQIRIHLKYLGYPIVADSFYAGRKTSRKDRLWCGRLFLHAEKICFKHPKSGKVVCFESPLHPDLSTSLESLSVV
jgi:23S rRNA pseudouridine1911/1915/1917 synthase